MALMLDISPDFVGHQYLLKGPPRRSFAITFLCIQHLSVFTSPLSSKSAGPDNRSTRTEWILSTCNHVHFLWCLDHHCYASGSHVLSGPPFSSSIRCQSTRNLSFDAYGVIRQISCVKEIATNDFLTANEYSACRCTIHVIWLLGYQSRHIQIFNEINFLVSYCRSSKANRARDSILTYVAVEVKGFGLQKLSEFQNTKPVLGTRESKGRRPSAARNILLRTRALGKTSAVMISVWINLSIDVPEYRNFVSMLL